MNMFTLHSSIPLHCQVIQSYGQLVRAENQLSWCQLAWDQVIEVPALIGYQLMACLGPMLESLLVTWINSIPSIDK